MALACLAAEAEPAGEKLARQGFALLDGSTLDLTWAVAEFDALREGAGADEAAESSLRIDPQEELVGKLLAQPAVRALVAELLGPEARPVSAIAFDQSGHHNWVLPWHQPGSGPDAAEGLILYWHLDLIGPADGGLRVLPGSHLKGRLTTEEIARLALEVPARELAVSAGTVVALHPLLVQGARRRTTRGHRRILQVALARS